MARIDRFVTRAQADLAAGFLQACGIDARVSADDAGGVHPDIAYGIGGTVVIVADDQVDEALELLDREFGAEPGDSFPEPAPIPGESSGSWGLPARLVVLVMVGGLLLVIAISQGWFVSSR